MGTTAEYVMVSKRELEQLLAGAAPSLADDLYDERYGFTPRFEPTQDTFQQEVAANPLLLLDQAKVRSHIEQMFERLKEQQALSQQRLRSGDSQDRLDEICKLYAWGQRQWIRCDIPRDFGGLSEDELALEAIKRGHHLRLDLDKRWDTMHELLTGITLRRRWDLAALSRAQPWIEKAKHNDNHPSNCVRDIEEARDAVGAMEKEMNRALDEFGCALHDLSPEVDDDRRDELLQILDHVQQTVWRAPNALYRTLMQVAAMQKQIDEGGMESLNAARLRGEASLNAVVSLFGVANVAGPVYMSWEQFIAGLVESAKTARLIETLMKDIVGKLRANKLSDAELEKAKQIAAESQRLEKLLSVPGWLNHFSSHSNSDVPIASPSDDDLLSLAVSGGDNCPGKNTHEASYLTVEQTKAIADVLKPLTSEELARKHHLSELADSEDFFQFKKFYLRAAQYEAGVVVFFSS